MTRSHGAEHTARCAHTEHACWCLPATSTNSTQVLHVLVSMLHCSCQVQLSGSCNTGTCGRCCSQLSPAQIWRFDWRPCMLHGVLGSTCQLTCSICTRVTGIAG